MDDVDNIYLDDLHSFDPNEWPNIPKPIVIAFNLLKKSMLKQEEAIQNLKKNSEFMNDRFTKSSEGAISLSKMLVAKSEENLKLIIRESEENQVYSLNILQKKLDKEEEFRALLGTNISALLSEQVDLLQKKISELPTLNNIKEAEKNIREELKEEFLNDVKHRIVLPEINNVHYKIKDRLTEIEGEIKEVKKRILDEGLYTSNNIRKNYEDITKIIESIREQSGKNEIKVDLCTSRIRDLTESVRNYEANWNKTMVEMWESLQQDIKILKIKAEEKGPRTPVVKTISLSPSSSHLNPAPQPPKTLITAPDYARSSEVPTDELRHEIREEINSVKNELHALLKYSEEKSTKDLVDSVQSIENKISLAKMTLENQFQELRDKFSWLPMKFDQLEGMSPTEARIFTLEARLRSEENSRIQGQHQILKFMENKSVQSQVRASPEIASCRKECFTPQILTSRQSSRSINKVFERKVPPGGMCGGDIWKRPIDSDRKKSIDGESVVLYGSKMRAHSPIDLSLIEESCIEQLKKERLNRKRKSIPKSFDSMDGSTPKYFNKEKS
ncbi:unnamed protein product [Blepharisma stoltei]|uniref:Uncharacterized protein n=1 Tax=Blepharisma stoltei TaxID=1481888 RepID=A0AAU9JTH5_9CILI|nr:unnamed protein product [Blepharisma stoltei]